MAKKKGKKKLTQNEKIGYTVALVFLVPLGMLLHLYYQAGLADLIILATATQTAAKMGLPTDPDNVPYAKPTSKKKSPLDDPSNDKSVFELIDRKGNIDGVKPVQKGGANAQANISSKFNKSINDAKGFLDVTKYDFPYTWTLNENLMMSSLGYYFETFFITMRTALFSSLQMMNDIFGQYLTKEPTDLMSKLTNFIAFAVVLPFCNTLLSSAQPIVSGLTLFWAAINNQSLFLIFWVIMAFVFIFLGGLSGYFWPFTFFSIYLACYILQSSPKKLEIFRTYGKRYKLIWIFMICSIWFLSISYVWEWDQIAMIASGVPCVMLFLTSIGFAASV